MSEFLFEQIRHQRILEQSKAFIDDDWEDPARRRRREEEESEAEERRREMEREENAALERKRKIDAIIAEKRKEQPVRPQDKALLDEGDEREKHFRAALQRAQAQSEGAAQRRAFRQAAEQQEDDDESSLGDPDELTAPQWDDLSDVEDLPGLPDTEESRAGFLLAQLATEKPTTPARARKVATQDPEVVARLLKSMADDLPPQPEGDGSSPHDEEVEEPVLKRQRVETSDEAETEYPERVREALQDFRELDPEAKVHGSYAVGLWDEHSDLDLLTSQHFADLRSPEIFKVLDYQATAAPARLRLQHKATMLELDVVKAASDPHALAKDAFVRSQLQRWPNGEALALARRLKRFQRRCAEKLPREQGYPNSFLLLLMGFFYLSHGSPPKCSGEPPEKCEEKLFQGWTNFVKSSENHRMTFDLRSEAEKAALAPGGAKEHWRIIEPISGRTVSWLDREKVKVFASLCHEEQMFSSLHLGL